MLSGIQFSVWKWNAYIRAYMVHHIEHILYVSESICFTDNELNWFTIKICVLFFSTVNFYVPKLVCVLHAISALPTGD